MSPAPNVCAVTSLVVVSLIVGTWTVGPIPMDGGLALLVEKRQATRNSRKSTNHELIIHVALSKQTDVHKTQYLHMQKGNRYYSDMNVTETERHYQNVNLQLEGTFTSAELISSKSNCNKSRYHVTSLESVGENVSDIASSGNHEVTNSQRYSPIIKYATNAPSHSTDELHHIGFLKVHKTGSSTMQNILFRFGRKRNLTFVLPKSGNYFSESIDEHNEVLSIPENRHYDILCNHAVFNVRTFRKYLPADTKYLAIVREPVSQFMSAASYFRDEEYLQKVQLRSPERWVHRLIWYPDKYDLPMYSHTRNSMARDFGFQSEDPEFHQQVLNYLNDTFSFAIITEKYDESLVLLKRHFRWEMADILYTPQLINRQKQSFDLSDKYVSKLRERNDLDFRLYYMFLSRLNTLIEHEGNDLHGEVEHFKDLLVLVKAHCLKLWEHRPLVVEATSWHGQFAVSHRDCAFMLMKPLAFQENMRKRHISQWNLGFSFSKIAHKETVN